MYDRYRTIARMKGYQWILCELRIWRRWLRLGATIVWIIRASQRRSDERTYTQKQLSHLVKTWKYQCGTFQISFLVIVATRHFYRVCFCFVCACVCICVYCRQCGYNVLQCLDVISISVISLWGGKRCWLLEWVIKMLICQILFQHIATWIKKVLWPSLYSLLTLA